MNFLLEKRFSFLMQNISSNQHLVLWGGGEICFSFYNWWQSNRPYCEFPKCVDSSTEVPTNVNGIDLLPTSHLVNLNPRYILITTINSQNEVLKQIEAISPKLSAQVITLVNSEIVRKHIKSITDSSESDLLNELLFDFPDEYLVWKLISESTDFSILKDKYFECSKKLKK